MGRTRLIRSDRLPYHVYARCNNQEWFYLDMQRVWEIFNYHLRTVSLETGLLVHAFVLMSNHYHMLVTTPNANLDYVMMLFQKRVSDSINQAAGRINHVFGGPYKWTLIETWFHYGQAYRYVLQNPLRAKLCSKFDEYPFSTLSRINVTTMKGPALSSSLFQGPATRHIERQGWIWEEWLNHLLEETEVRVLRKALYRRKFKICPDRISHKIPSSLVAPRDPQSDGAPSAPSAPPTNSGGLGSSRFF
jgi:putative transposase